MTEGLIVRWLRASSLAAKVMLALTLTLLPPGILAVVAAVHTYQEAARRGAPLLRPAQALSIGMPVLMWLAALAIGWLIANRLIVRPLTRLRGAVEAYVAGDKSVRLGGDSFFSREVGALAGAFDRLADDIACHDAEIAVSLGEQRRLTREVHHRVKNNLQIVSSLLSIQSREAANAEVAHAYATIQARVAALAIVHRWMYESDAPRGGEVDLKALTSDLAAGLEQSLAATEQVPVSLVPVVERIFVAQDTAVPLAFLITELVSCAARASAPDGLDARIVAQADNGQAVLQVVAAVFVGDDLFARDSQHPSSRIIAGMARQLRSPLLHDGVAGSYRIAFPLPAAPKA